MVGDSDKPKGSGSLGSYVPLSSSCGDTLSDTFLSYPPEHYDLSYIHLPSPTEVPCRW